MGLPEDKRHRLTETNPAVEFQELKIGDLAGDEFGIPLHSLPQGTDQYGRKRRWQEASAIAKIKHIARSPSHLQ